MEDLPIDGVSVSSTTLPEAGHDAQDPLRPESEEENSTATPPSNEPHQDIKLAEDKLELSDDDSDLSDIDEAQFEDFDPNAIAIDRPVAVDESNVGLIGVHKRKRADDGDALKKKKKKEGKREKPKKRRQVGGDEAPSGGEDGEERRARRKKDQGERKERSKVKSVVTEDENDLTPEERRRRALDRAMDAAVQTGGNRRRKADGVDLEAMADEMIETMRRRMTEAAKNDTDARQADRPAMQKLKLLPEVVALLNRNNLRDQIVDPDINLLEAVRFFLEPLNDGSLPAYNIQRDLFQALSKLPINKDALVASGIGKVTWFYTKSTKPELGIRRMAERLLGEWQRPILKRSDDYRKREFREAVYDPAQRVASTQPASTQQAAIQAARDRKLALPVLSNRARVEGGPSSYSIVPRSNIVTQGQTARPLGSSGEEAFRRMKQRQITKTPRRPRS